MDKKLTLSLNAVIIESAKEYAKAQNTSLSKLLESYLAALIRPKEQIGQITPLVKSLSGVISIDEDVDLKEEYTDYLIEKYK